MPNTAGAKDEIDRALRDAIRAYPHHNVDLKSTALYAVSSQGRRWRPRLLLEVGKAISKTAPPAGMMSLAVAIELIHTVSIILDDLPSMDNGTERRGQRCCHLQFGQSRSILVSFWLCDIAEHLLERCHHQNAGGLSDAFRGVRNRLIRGQVLDLAAGMRSEASIVRMCELKSGSLYSFAASAPARLLNRREMMEPLARFGKYLGIAYQIGDDILDIAGVSGVSGKDIAQDIGKDTIPRKFGRQRAEVLRKRYLDKALAEIKELPISTTNISLLAREICAAGV